MSDDAYEEYTKRGCRGKNKKKRPIRIWNQNFKKGAAYQWKNQSNKHRIEDDEKKSVGNKQNSINLYTLQ